MTLDKDTFRIFQRGPRTHPDRKKGRVTRGQKGTIPVIYCITIQLKLSTEKNNYLFSFSICNLGRAWQGRYVSAPCCVSLGSLTGTKIISKIVHIAGKLVPVVISSPSRPFPGVTWASSPHGGWIPRMSVLANKVKAESPFLTQPWKSHSITPTTICWLTSHKSQPSLTGRGHGPPSFQRKVARFQKRSEYV